MGDKLMEEMAKFLGYLQNDDDLDKGSTKEIEEEDITENTDTFAEKDIRSVSEENTTIEEEESKLETIQKSEIEENNLTQQSLHKTEASSEKECEKEEDKNLPEENNNEIVNISQPKDSRVPKLHEDELSMNHCINPIEEIKKEDEKTIKPSYSEEGKDDSISVSHEDAISVRCQNDLMIDLHEESVACISKNVDECDKDEKDQEKPINCHPYSFLIESFELTKEQKMQTKIGPPKSLEETPVRMVNSRIGLLKLLPVLNSAKEIALRMQMDNNNQFEPSIQLMAISTRETDYVIDVAKLNKELLLLTEIFINPKIVKIIFGAGRVLSTLQNLLHLYVINIFDCESAGKALQTGIKSVDMILQKEYSYRLVDGMRQVNCRSRPLSPQFQDYCRAIPHYLIYIYHDYKNKLLSKDENLYKELMAKFREASKIVYPPYRTTQLLSLEKELQNHHRCQLEVLEKLNEWRNDTAINLNKNPVAVLPKPQLITLSSTLPVTEFSICCISKSPFVKDDAEKILAIIKEARGKYHLKEKKLKSSKKKIQDFKYLLLKELNGSNLNVDRKMRNKFEKSKFQKIDEVVTVPKRNKLGQKKRKKMKKRLTASPLKSQQNTNYYKTGNDDSSKDSSSNRNSGSSNVEESRNLPASDSYNVMKIQKRINTLKRELSRIHEGTDGVDHNLNKKRS